MNDYVEAKLIDEQIRKIIESGDLYSLVGLLNLSEKDIEDSISVGLRKGNLLSEDLKEKILIARDRRVLKLKDVEVSIVNSEEIHMVEAFKSLEIVKAFDYSEERGKFTIVKGRDEAGKENVLYYYGGVRIYDQYRDNKGMIQASKISKSGQNLQIASIVYKSNNYGNIKSQLVQGEISGMNYREFDEKEHMVLYIDENHLEQEVEKNGDLYMVIDGYYRFTEKGRVISESDIVRNIFKGDMFLETYKDFNGKQEIFNILREVQEIFKELKQSKVVEDNESYEKMQRALDWFEGLIKRFKIAPELAIQDDEIISTMKSAVVQTIGDLSEIDKQIQASTKEKEYEGDVYGEDK